MPIVLTTDIPGLERRTGGKIRDVYELDDQLLIVTTDRVEVGGAILPFGLPDKGRVLNQLSAFWFDLLRNTAPSHYISADFAQIAEVLHSYRLAAEPDLLSGRSMLVNKARPLPVRALVRGYMTAAAWAEYQASGRVAGHLLPAGLMEADRLPEPLSIPVAKGSGDGEAPLTEGQMFRLAEPGHLRRMIDQALALYERAARYALERRLILAEATFEFGVFQGMTILIGECLTPDCARYWDAESYRPGGPPSGYGHQYLLDYLESMGWERQAPGPRIPMEILARTAERYREAFRRLTGRELD